MNQWSRLTLFYQQPGVPPDTNWVEQTLTIVVRYLARSFNDKTENGADVGDRHMSLIASARANDLEPVAYLKDCLRNDEELARIPDAYVPWNYRERLREENKLPNPEPDPGEPADSG
jgi:hypothetical protein